MLTTNVLRFRLASQNDEAQARRRARMPVCLPAAVHLDLGPQAPPLALIVIEDRERAREILARDFQHHLMRPAAGLAYLPMPLDGTKIGIPGHSVLPAFPSHAAALAYFKSLGSASPEDSPRIVPPDHVLEEYL